MISMGARCPRGSSPKTTRTEPAAVGLDAAVRRLVLALLEGGSLDNLAIPVADSFAAGQELLLARALGIDVEVLAWDGERDDRRGQQSAGLIGTRVRATEQPDDERDGPLTRLRLNSPVSPPRFFFVPETPVLPTPCLTGAIV